MYEAWKNAVLGIGLDVDRQYGKQCADPILSYGQAIFPGVHWSVLFPPVKSAKQMYDTYNPQYFDRVANDRNNVNQVPPKGAIVIFAASPEQGYTSTFANNDGTIGVVDVAEAGKSYLIMLHQDSAEREPKVRLKQRPWRYTRCIGWLIPKAQAKPQPAPSVGDSRIGRTLYIHGIPAKSVVRVGAEPTPKNIYNYLLPGRWKEGPHGQPGLQYKIEGVSQYPNTVTIRTGAFGLVDVFVDKDCEIL